MTADNFIAVYNRLRGDLLRGKTIRILDIARHERPEAIAALAQLRDELPIRMSWRTVSESHLTETRMRCRCYSISHEHLNELVGSLQ
jgi:hypothetical protein